MSTWYPQVTERKGRVARIISFLKTHPLLCLLILTPGIPEYLSGSSNMSILVLNPPVFFLLLAANLALYGPGAILIREAKIRWNKGWASVFLMGAAYGIVEEGLALRTLFNPTSSVVGNLGVYGHWLGVNWVWTVGLVIFHSVFSIGLPIFIFGLAFPDLKSKSFVSTRGIQISILTLAIDSVLLSVVVNYWPAEIWGLILLSSIVVALLVIAAKKLPANFLKSVRAEPRWRPGGPEHSTYLEQHSFLSGCLQEASRQVPISSRRSSWFSTSSLHCGSFGSSSGQWEHGSTKPTRSRSPSD